MVNHLPAMRETWVRSLGQEDPLEKEMATHSSILAWRITWTDEPSCLQSMRLQRVGHSWVTNTFTFHKFHILLICGPFMKYILYKLFFKILIGGVLLYNIVVVFAIHSPEKCSSWSLNVSSLKNLFCLILKFFLKSFSIKF